LRIQNDESRLLKHQLADVQSRLGQGEKMYHTLTNEAIQEVGHLKHATLVDANKIEELSRQLPMAHMEVSDSRAREGMIQDEAYRAVVTERAEPANSETALRFTLGGEKE
jgi:hypothetical protein